MRFQLIGRKPCVAQCESRTQSINPLLTMQSRAGLWSLFVFIIPQVIMNTSLVKNAPQGDFAEVSVLTQGWETQFLALVRQKQPIKYDMYPRPNIPPEICNLLNQQGYKELILENDRWQHFLVPNSN
jgi:hypothetical protein